MRVKDHFEGIVDIVDCVGGSGRGDVFGGQVNVANCSANGGSGRQGGYDRSSGSGIPLQD